MYLYLQKHKLHQLEHLNAALSYIGTNAANDKKQGWCIIRQIITHASRRRIRHAWYSIARSVRLMIAA